MDAEATCFDYNYPPPTSSAHSNVTDALVELLTGMPQLERLALSVGGSPTAHLIHVFEKLQRVRKFELANWADEVEQPLYVHPLLCIELCFSKLITDFPISLFLLRLPHNRIFANRLHLVTHAPLAR